MVRLHYSCTLYHLKNATMCCLMCVAAATVPTTVMSFSSYAGLLSSWDDFYIMDRYNHECSVLQCTTQLYCHQHNKCIVTRTHTMSWSLGRITVIHCSVVIMYFQCYSGLVMLQTTNDILNKTLYDYATSQALLAWHRVRVANWMASGGKEWAEHLASYNSGNKYVLPIINCTFHYSMTIHRYIQQSVHGIGFEEDPPQAVD